MKEIYEEIQVAIKGKKVVIGSRETLKEAKKGEIKVVIHSSNIPDSLQKDLARYSEASALDVKAFDGDSVRLGQVCGKPFSILVIGIKK
ncbi:MAG: 50S ribosomal protein L30e [Candidatus Aenigmarchaeota archaeon]|nr:50S ribosomal protein L30e [Candidatus Aenigmarchaeota archaeon]